MTHSASLEAKEDLTVNSLRKLTIESCNLDALLLKDDGVKEEVQSFLDSNSKVWITYEEPQKVRLNKKYSKT